jgi:hypothetical protein
MGFEPIIRGFGRAKTVQPLDRMATVIGEFMHIRVKMYCSMNFLTSAERSALRYGRFTPAILE